MTAGHQRRRIFSAGPAATNRAASPPDEIGRAADLIPGRISSERDRSPTRSGSSIFEMVSSHLASEEAVESRLGHTQASADFDRRDLAALGRGIGLGTADLRTLPRFRDDVGVRPLLSASTKRDGHRGPFLFGWLLARIVASVLRLDNLVVIEVLRKISYSTRPNRRALPVTYADTSGPGRPGRKPKEQKRTIPMSLRLTPAMRASLVGMAGRQRSSITRQTELLLEYALKELSTDYAPEPSNADVCDRLVRLESEVAELRLATTNYDALLTRVSSGLSDLSDELAKDRTAQAGLIDELTTAIYHLHGAAQSRGTAEGDFPTASMHREGTIPTAESEAIVQVPESDRSHEAADVPGRRRPARAFGNPETADG
jgi:hypothetical protein